MAAKVVDASALAAILFVEPDGEEILGAIEDHQLHVPRLVMYEVANVARTKVRRRPESRALIEAQVTDLGRIDLTVHDPEPSALIEIALETGLTAYDAAYLWLARTLGAELVTLDARLKRAAAR